MSAIAEAPTTPILQVRAAMFLCYSTLYANPALYCTVIVPRYAGMPASHQPNARRPGSLASGRVPGIVARSRIVAAAMIVFDPQVEEGGGLDETWIVGADDLTA